MDLTGVTLDTTIVGAAGLIVVTGLAVLWGIKKGVGMFGTR